jgi:hypothetical protein
MLSPSCRRLLTAATCLLLGCTLPVSLVQADHHEESAGWITLFDGQNLDAWTLRSPAAEGIWSVKNGVIDCNPVAGGRADKNLWSKQSFGDFTLRLEWRLKTPQGMAEIPTILPNGTYKLNQKGERVVTRMAVADSGVYVRGSSKHQINIWNWPIGSGEVYGYRNNNPDDKVRASVTPKLNADRPLGEWNTFEITMVGKDLTVILNGKVVIDQARLAEAAEFAPIALQHHGGYDAAKKTWLASSSVVQFRNIKIKEL